MIDKDKYKGKSFSLATLRALIAQTLYKNVDWNKVHSITIDGTTYLYNKEENTLKPQTPNND